MLTPPSLRRTMAIALDNQPGSLSVHMARTRKIGERLMTHCKCNIICEGCFLCKSVISCPTCHKYPHYCFKPVCRNHTAPVLKNMGSPGCQPQGHENPQGSLYPPLLELAISNKLSSNHNWLGTSPQAYLPGGGLTDTCAKESNRSGQSSSISGFLLSTFIGPKPNNKWRSVLDLSSLNKFLKSENSNWRHRKVSGLPFRQVKE